MLSAAIALCRYISSFLRRRGGWTKYQKQQAQLLQRQQQQQPGSSGTVSQLGRAAAAPQHEAPGATGKPCSSTNGTQLNPGQQVNPEQPRLQLAGLQPGAAFKPRSVREVAEEGQGLTRAIGKTLGVLSQQVGEWEAVEAEEQLMQEEEGGGGEGDDGLPEVWNSVRDYYFDDEAHDDDDLEGPGGLQGMML